MNGNNRKNFSAKITPVFLNGPDTSLRFTELKVSSSGSLTVADLRFDLRFPESSLVLFSSSGLSEILKLSFSKLRAAFMQAVKLMIAMT